MKKIRMPKSRALLLDIFHYMSVHVSYSPIPLQTHANVLVFYIVDAPLSANSVL